MKKYLLITLGTMLLITLAQAKDLPGFSSAIERAVAAQVMPFANSRVKQICQEWPTCEEWVENKIGQNPSFKVVDTEVERWLSKWDGDTAIWQYRFYVQTQENGQIKAYQFARGEQGISYSAPVLIKKFPGHPGKPTEHIFTSTVTDENIRSLCNSWPGYTQWHSNQHKGPVTAAITSQYIYKRDIQGNALWKKRLYVRVGPRSRFVTAFYFQAYQTESNGGFIYQVPIETGKFPYCSAF